MTPSADVPFDVPLLDDDLETSVVAARRVVQQAVFVRVKSHPEPAPSASGSVDGAAVAAGTYGLSVDSGEQIPDERLEVVPTAERTVEEEAAG